MPKLPIIKPSELLRALRKLGFYDHHQVGSHLQLKHSDGRRITVPVHKGKDIRSGTLRGIIKDLDITVEEFIEIIKG